MKNKLAVLSWVLPIVGVTLWFGSAPFGRMVLLGFYVMFVTGVLGLVFGTVALNEASRKIKLGILSIFLGLVLPPVGLVLYFDSAPFFGDVILPFVFSLIALFGLIFGIVSLKTAQDIKSGEERAIIGIVLSTLLILFWSLILFGGLWA